LYRKLTYLDYTTLAVAIYEEAGSNDANTTTKQDERYMPSACTAHNAVCISTSR